ncbi:MAG: sugar-binding transcriptional regulator [Caldilinea sp.]|nr:sugar-binding transcriptional regulator [Caldilinea sp.]MDW8440070.1 sugar-binding transcriptional regulator [Caldilineaceae bacterium]
MSNGTTHSPDELRGDRTDLLVTVATLYYELGQNQQQIADRLETSRSSVSRMIKEARDLGIVEIRIHRPVNRAYALEQALIDRFGLTDAYVLLTNPDQRDEERLAGVGRLAAGYLERVLGQLPPHACIGIAWGTGVHAAISALGEDRSRQIDVVQILGSLGAANPLIDGPDLARLLASKLGGRYFDLHAPALVEQPALRDLLLNEPSVRDGLQRARSVALAITGIGTVQEEAASFLRAGHLSPEDLAELRRQGVVGETVGRFFDVHGRFAQFDINARVIGIDLPDLRKIPRVIAVARGLPKAMSILGALRGRYMTVLATDDQTAQAVLALADAR